MPLLSQVQPVRSLLLLLLLLCLHMICSATQTAIALWLGLLLLMLLLLLSRWPSTGLQTVQEHKGSTATTGQQL
jgi:hypothetical protein